MGAKVSTRKKLNIHAYIHTYMHTTLSTQSTFKKKKLEKCGISLGHQMQK
jgi:hypothetical protein